MSQWALRGPPGPRHHKHRGLYRSESEGHCCSRKNKFQRNWVIFLFIYFYGGGLQNIGVNRLSSREYENFSGWINYARLFHLSPGYKKKKIWKGGIIRSFYITNCGSKLWIMNRCVLQLRLGFAPSTWRMSTPLPWLSAGTVHLEGLTSTDSHWPAHRPEGPWRWPSSSGSPCSRGCWTDARTTWALRGWEGWRQEVPPRWLQPQVEHRTRTPCSYNPAVTESDTCLWWSLISSFI